MSGCAEDFNDENATSCSAQAADSPGVAPGSADAALTYEDECELRAAELSRSLYALHAYDVLDEEATDKLEATKWVTCDYKRSYVVCDFKGGFMVPIREMRFLVLPMVRWCPRLHLSTQRLHAYLFAWSDLTVAGRHFTGSALQDTRLRP